MDTSGDSEVPADIDADAAIETLAEDAEALLADTPAATHRRRRTIVVQVLLALVVIGALAVSLELQHGRLRQAARGLGHLHWAWVAGAVLAEAASMGALARMQRRLLRAGDLHMAVASALAITYAGNAISGSIPMAGSQMSVAFTYREFERRGADRASAAVALVVSGVISSVTLSVIVAAGAIASGNDIAALAGLAGTVVLLALACGGLLAWRNPRLGRVIERGAARAISVARRVARRRGEDPAPVVAGLRDQLNRLHFSHRDWLFAAFFGAANWLTDIVCLGLSIRATGLHLPFHRLILVWSAGSAASSLGLTPGGVGVVDVALIAALTAAGVRSVGATTAVAVYRLISFWAKLLIGWLVYILLRRRSRKATATPAVSGVTQQLS